MAAKAVPAAVPGGGAAGADILSGRSPVRSSPAPSTSAAPNATSSHSPRSGAGTTDRHSPGANSSTRHTAQSSGGGSASASGSGDSRGAGSGSPGSAGKGRSTDSGNPSADSGSGKRSAGTGSAAQEGGATGVSSTGAAQTLAQGAARAAAGANDFAAALAQSLAATPANGAPTTGTSTGTAAAKSQAAGADQSSESPAKHSAADPVSSALTLLQQTLAGALAGISSTPAVASAVGTSANGPSSSASSPNSGTIDTAGKSSAAALTALLAQNLTTDTKAGGSNPAPADGPAASAASSASAATAATASAAAALTAAAQLSSGSHIGSRQGAIDSSRMALASPVGTNAWTDELGTKLTWMAHQGIESASLQLSPEHLGPMQVTISVHNGQASVWFGAAQPDTRTALQQSLPQLRQLFAGQGLTLADAGVSREPPRGQSGQSSARPAASVSAASAVNLESPGTRASITGGLGLLDTYV